MLELKDLDDGGIVICSVYDIRPDSHYYNYCYSRYNGVYNRNKNCIILTSNSENFYFDNNDYVGVRYEFEILDNIKSYNHNDKEVKFLDIFNYLINKNWLDLTYEIYNNTDGDIGYFDDYPVNLVEVRNGLITSIMIGRTDSQDNIICQ